MKRVWLYSMMAVALLSRGQAAETTFVNPAGTTLVYANHGVAINPQIDAVNFVNRGIFEAGSLNPFETSDTLNYTNTGTMSGALGWRFDTAPATAGVRKMANSFVNLSPGVVEALDEEDLGTAISTPCAIAPVFPSYLLIWAKTIINRGSSANGASLLVGANGELDLNGVNVDLSYSGVGVLPVWNASEVFGNFLFPAKPPPTAFIPDSGIVDLDWSLSAFTAANSLDTTMLWDGAIATAPPVGSPPSAPVPFLGTTFFPVLADSYLNVLPKGLVTVIVTNSDGSTFPLVLYSNIVKGAVFVGASPGVGVQAGFLPSTQKGNSYETPTVLLTIQLSNALSQVTDTAYLYFDDMLASQTAYRLLSTNLVGCPTVTFRPDNFLLTRLPLPVGFPGNWGYPEPQFFSDSGNIFLNPGTNNPISTDLATNFSEAAGPFASYDAFVDNAVSRPAPVFGGTYTNLPGRVNVKANNLNLTQTRMRAEGVISIVASNLVTSSQTVIDCENLAHNLGSSTGTLKVQNLIPDSVLRLRGEIHAYSAQWNDTVQVIITNNWSFLTNTIIGGTTNAPTTNTVTVATLSPLTNTVNVGYAVTMFDASAISYQWPVTTWDFAAHSKNVIINDNMTVPQSLLIDGQNLTINGSVTIPGVLPIINPIPDPLTGLAFPTPGVPLTDWGTVNAPSLLNFTNNGSFVIESDGNAQFGDDAPVRYSSFYNGGFVDAGSIQVNSAFYQNSGTLEAAVGPLILQADNGKMQGGVGFSGNGIQLLGQNLKLFNSTLSAAGTMDFYITNSLYDGGAFSSNVVSVAAGFNLWHKPPIGDLLGTTLSSTSPDAYADFISHAWAGQDRGPVTAGYFNNEAVGVLSVSAPSAAPTFFFTGAGPGASNAIYVDLLDLSGLPDPTNQLAIDNKMVIYYAAAKLPFTPPPGRNNVAVEPEEFLNHQLGGRLRWDINFAGPNSSTPVVINGVSYLVNAALRNSLFIDSNSNGIPNGLDPSPFSSPPPGAILNGPDPFGAPTAQLVVQIVGGGTVNSNYNGKALVVGQNYSMTAQPKPGYVFAGWSGGMVSASPAVSFTMRSNLTLVASFTPLPASAQIPNPGTYLGLFYESNGVEFLKSGSFTATVKSHGSYSGSLQMGQNYYGFNSQFDANGLSQCVIRRSGTNGPLTLQLQATTNQITGTIGDGAWVANLLADLAVYSSRANPAPFAGHYSLLFPGTGNPGDLLDPQGDGYANLTVSASGAIQLSGSLADGTPLGPMSSATPDALWPLYISLYGGKGQLLGWLDFTETASSDLSGPMSWIKLPSPGKYYSGGFDYQPPAYGSLYNASLKPITGFSNGVLELTGGNLAAGVSNLFTLNANLKVTNLSSNKLSLSFRPSQGFFNGSVFDPAAGKSISFYGILLQKPGIGAGYFLGTNQSGNVLLGP